MKRKDIMSIYYIHGFGSNLNSSTLKMLQEHYPDAIGLTYDHTHPGISIQKMADQLNSDPSDKIIVGSSLGGWYAEQLTNKVVADFILYNPQTEPYIGLSKYGVQQPILFKYLVASEVNSFKRPASRIVILCEDDTTVPYNIAYNKYYGKSSVILTTGGHRMTTENMLFVADAIKSLQGKLT
jgi:predicted esterase YcpF (UPF0227 family)